MNRKNKLVAGLICGNEEPRIERCVKSLQQICDEIVIVRAIGSLEPDRTLSISKKLGCYVGEYFNSPLVSDWPHVDDFGRARNQAFSQAYELAGCDGWVMWADCDDVLMPEMAEPHLKALQDCPSEFQWILTDYVIAEQNKRAPRERFFRYKTGWWYRPIHENVQPTNDVKLYMRRDLEIVHQPPIGVRPSNERNKRILMHNDKMSSHYKFYLHYENFITGNHAESAKYGSEALAMTDLDGVHKYETLMNCSMLTTEETALRLVKQARVLDPNRREAYGLEASTLLDNNKPQEALLLVEEMLKIPVPNFKQWTHREEWYAWKAQHLKAWCLRMLNRSDEAKEFEMSGFKTSNLPKISLIHATRGRPLVATQAMAMWYSRAKHPERIEHIFVFDHDDKESERLKQFRHTIQTENGYSVGAWNLGAKECIGDIIIQLSDDWECPPAWDKMIESRLDITKEQVLRISDGYRKDELLCMAILTRPYFEKHGLFNPAFKNVYSDTDFTFRAAKNNAIVEAKDIAIIHHHPFWENRPLDATYERGNDVDEYDRAKAIFEAEHLPAKYSEIIPKGTSNQFGNEKWLWFTAFSQTHQEIYDKHFLPSFNEYLAQHCELHARKLNYHVGSFGEEQFNKAGRVMQQEAIDILRKNIGRKIILSGCDFRFYRDFIPEIETALHTAELVGINDIYGPICGDFSAFILTERILKLYEWVLENDVKFPNQQWTFNAGIEALGIRAQISSDLFWTYGIQERKVWEDGDEVRPPKNICLHHANFTVGAENKMKLLNAVLKKMISSTQINGDSQRFDLTPKCGAT